MTGLADREPHEWHIITCEYPPSVGGVSDYSFTLASGLGATGTVHVWCPAGTSAAPEVEHVTVHDAPGSFSLRDLDRLGTLLDSSSWTETPVRPVGAAGIRLSLDESRLRDVARRSRHGAGRTGCT